MTLVPVRTVEVAGGELPPIRADLYLPGTGVSNGVVVLCHGLKGYKTWGFFPYLAERLCGKGLAALSMDMSLNGTYPADGDSGSGRIYVRPDLFERNTLQREYLDVQAVVRMLAEGGLRGDIGDRSAIGLFGHSRGGVPCILNALEMPAVQALCTWSTTDDPDFYTKKQKERWRRDGVYAFTDAEGTRLGLGIDYLNDLEENHDFYRLVDRVVRLKTPHLIVHGASDVVIPMESASALHDAETELEHKRLVVMRTGHTFGLPYPAPDPVEKPPAALVSAADETADWFAKHLSEGEH